MMVPVLVGGALFAHGLIHVLYVLPAPADPNYPFTFDGSWLIPDSARRVVGLVLVVVTVLAFSALALTVWSVGGLDSVWKPLTIIGSVASLAVLVAFWHPWIVVGVVIDVGLLTATLVVPDWWTRLPT
jgi:hypothetical protein